MKKVRMLRLEAGPKGTFDVGEIREVSNVRADVLVQGGYAEFLREPEMETTVSVTAEEREMTVATPKPRRKAKKTVKRG